MKLRGSCHCGAVRFTLESHTPCPYMLCYCSICRKTGGGGGYAINIGGDAATLEIEGEAEITVYRARLGEGDEPEGGEAGLSPARRHFCRHCGSALWVADPRWPELVHPFASAIDTALPESPDRVEIMLDHAPTWARPPGGPSENRFAEYPDQSLAEWHRAHELYQD